MRIIFFGTPQIAVGYLEALQGAGHEVAAVVTQPDRPAGRGRKLRASPVKEAALGRAMRVLQPDSAASPQFIREIAELEPEAGVVVAYGQILKPALLAVPSVAFVNVHYSLLPLFRGAAPVYAALREGHTQTGVTIQHVAEELDAGDIILQRALDIREDDDRGTLTERLTELGTQLLLEALDLLGRGEAPRTPQDHARATYAPRVKSDDCRICWSQSATKIRHQVRACTPWPGAWCTVRGNRLRVLSVTAVRNSLSQEGDATEVVEVGSHSGLVVRTGQGLLSIERVQPAGKRAMSAAEFVRGARLEVGDQLQ
jgi:methionyl-tRNA formyltransferase